jgi:hypothetical protein
MGRSPLIKIRWRAPLPATDAMRGHDLKTCLNGADRP